MNKHLHPSWLIAVGSVGLVFGASVSLFLDAMFWSRQEWILVCVGLSVIAFVTRSRFAIGYILIVGVLFGLFRGSTMLIALGNFDELYNQSVSVHGQVAEDVGISNDGDTQLRLKNISVDGVGMSGVVWVNTTATIDIRRSDIIVVEGRLTEGFGNIPATIYRGRVISIERQDYADLGRDIRDTFARGIRASIQEPEASLASGFLAGQKTALPEKLDNELRLLGLTHIVVASGYNLTILVRFARRLLTKVSRFTALAGASGLVLCFMQITGASPSMARASLVTALSLITWYYGRKIHPIVLLSFAVGITVAINPAYAWGDLGWLLSFTSFIGVIIFAPLLHSYFWADVKPGFIRQVVFETMSAQLLTLPIIAVIFGMYSPLSLLANLLILPLIPVVMALIFIAGLVGMVSAVLAPLAGFPAEVILMYMTSVVNHLARLPLAAREVSFSTTALIASYVVIFLAILILWRKSGHVFRDYNVTE